LSPAFLILIRLNAGINVLKRNGRLGLASYIGVHAPNMTEPD
jgi:hypothetical protein